MPTVVVHNLENARIILGNVTNEIQPLDVKDKTKLNFPSKTTVKPNDNKPIHIPIPCSNELKEFSDIFSDLEYNNEYILEVYSNTAKLEHRFIPVDYFSVEQHRVTEKMRTILIEWLVQIQEEFQLCHETLYKAVIIKDLYLSRTTDCIKLEEYQLVGACSLWIASKYEEIYPPNLANFSSLCDNIYSKRRFMQMERDIMRTIDFQLYMPVPYTLTRVLNKIVDGNMALLTLARYICELTLVNFDCCQFASSRVATSCFFIALKMYEHDWSQKIQEFTGYSPFSLKPVIIKLNEILHESFQNKKKTQIRLKYIHPVFFKVAQKSPIPTSALF
ncbi:G2/mitotic-specific cyclin-B3 isoform X1 [Oopsacas minuta]|uniref:G2/mitotic-specific cyclin-B3 isoform X1 n=1 Tax=Oopsacas minuta TaxID=111878 RepID=A0AAV7K1T4_9METZ|nr:G2/mitotic-specific cyclin-B3 isoform X1 [Oopsacas minuta]